MAKIQITKDFLINTLKLTDEQSEYYYSKIEKSSFHAILNQSEQMWLDKIDFYKNEVGLSLDQILNYFTLLVLELSEKPSSANKRIEYYKTELGFTKKQFQKIPNIITSDTFSSPEENPSSIRAKVKFFKTELGFTNKQLKTTPSLLSYDCILEDINNPTSIRSKIKFYKDILGFTNKQFQILPKLLTSDCSSDESVPTSIRAKIKFYKDILGFTNKQFQQFPTLLCYDTYNEKNKTSVIRKIKFYKEKLGLTNENLQKFPTLLGLDCDENSKNPKSVIKKLTILNEIGITLADIQNNPRILMCPTDDLKIKYMLWSTMFPDKSYMKINGWFVTSPEKIYARYMYIKHDLGLNSSPRQLDESEPEFKRQFKASSNDLMKLYPLNENAIDQIYETYNSLKIEPPLQKD